MFETREERLSRTVRNPRWWLLLPFTVSIVLLALVMVGLAGFLRWLGQALCGVSNYIMTAPTPAWIRAIFKWGGHPAYREGTK